MTLVYSAKNYCVLKMSENKEKIRFDFEILLQKREECNSGC